MTTTHTGAEAEELKLPKDEIEPFYGVFCPECRWVGSSEECILDSEVEEYSEDMLCPSCYKKSAINPLESCDEKDLCWLISQLRNRRADPLPSPINEHTHKKCEACGSPVVVVSSKEGTNHYEPVPQAHSTIILSKEDVEAVKHLLFLHSCEMEGLELPKPQQWYDAVGAVQSILDKLEGR